MSHATDRPLERDWVTTPFLIGTPLVAFIGLGWYLTHVGFFWADFLLFVVMYMATGMSITAGYHRYFSHKTYEIHPVVKFLYLVFGATAVENSAISWSSDHRLHHRYVDSDKDPYDIMKGIFWAHMGWIFYKTWPVRTYDNAPDLKADRMVMWQHRWYLAITMGMSFGVPLVVSLFTGRPGGALLWGAVLRVVACHHGTFLINSAAHAWGFQPYSVRDTSRDNPFLAMFTFGEGYHNFHHTFQTDYRNGIRWYHWDPSKWLINTLRFLGLAWNLNRATDYAITRARMEMDETRVRRRLEAHSVEWRERLWARYGASRARLEGALLRVIALRRRYQAWVASVRAQVRPSRHPLARGWSRRLKRGRTAVALARVRYADRLREATRLPLPARENA